MPARMASGSVGQASMSAAKAGSMARVWGASAPLFAPTGEGFVVLLGDFAEGSSPLGGNPLVLQATDHGRQDLQKALVRKGFLRFLGLLTILGMRWLHRFLRRNCTAFCTTLRWGA
jgi:hypothetical protein